MKYLKIENNQGFYWDGSEYQEIDKINKDDLLKLLSSAEADGFEIDPYDEEHLANKAHQIIYGNIYSKLEQFLNDKNQFKTEVERLYKEAIGKYSVKIEENEDYEEPEEVSSSTSEEDIPF